MRNENEKTKTTIDDEANNVRMPWGRIWATVARIYYLVFAAVLFFRMLTLIDVGWSDLLIAGTVPAVFVLTVIFVDGVWIWYVRNRPAWKRKGVKNADQESGVAEMGSGGSVDSDKRDAAVR